MARPLVGNITGIVVKFFHLSKIRRDMLGFGIWDLGFN
jgi:hypothetical protein